MARVPKKVGASSGQGVSRRSYQVGRSLGMKGGGAPGTNPSPPPAMVQTSSPATGGGGVASGKRDYGKGGGSNIAYSEREMPNPNLKALKAVGAAKAPRGGKGFVL